MNSRRLLAATVLTFGFALGILGNQVVEAQGNADEEPITREELQKRPLQTAEGKQARVVRVQLAPGASFADGPTVTYPAEEFVYIAEGSGVLQREGEELEIEAGDSFYNRRDEPHNVINTGDEPLTAVAVWIGDEGDF